MGLNRGAGRILVEWLVVVAVIAGLSGCHSWGSTAVPRTADGVRLPAYSRGVPSLFVPLPEGYRVRRRQSPDFDVYNVTWRGEGVRAEGIINVGRAPRYFYKRTRGVSDVEPQVTTVGNERVPVYQFVVDGESHCKEAILTDAFAGAKRARVFVHIASFGDDAEQVDAFWGILTKIRPASR